MLVCKDNELEERSKHLGLEVQEHIKLKPRFVLVSFRTHTCAAAILPSTKGSLVFLVGQMVAAEVWARNET